MNCLLVNLRILTYSLYFPIIIHMLFLQFSLWKTQFVVRFLIQSYNKTHQSAKFNGRTNWDAENFSKEKSVNLRKQLARVYGQQRFMTVSADSSSELFVQDGVNFKCQVMMKLKNNVHLKTIRIPGFIFLFHRPI